MGSQTLGRRLEPVESVVAPPRKCLPHDGAVNHGESRSSSLAVAVNHGESRSSPLAVAVDRSAQNR